MPSWWGAVATPRIRSALGFSAPGVQWVASAYTRAFAGFLLAGGRAADMIGRRRIFTLGPSATLVATADAGPGAAGLASALLNSSRQFGGALGLAILFTTGTQHGGRLHAIPTGYPTAALLGAGIDFLALCLSGRFPFVVWCKRAIICCVYGKRG